MWEEMGLLRIIPMMSVIIVCDSIFNISGRVASFFGMAEMRDTILLALAALSFAVLLTVLSFSPVYFESFHTYKNEADLLAQLDRDRVLIFSQKTIQLLPFLSIPIVLLLTWKQARSPLVWLMIGFLGNLGAVVWLLVRHYEGKNLKRPL